MITTHIISAQRVAGAISLVGADMEHHLRELGRYHIARGEDVPEWIIEDLHAALALQGVFEMPDTKGEEEELAA